MSLTGPLQEIEELRREVERLRALLRDAETERLDLVGFLEETGDAIVNRNAPRENIAAIIGRVVAKHRALSTREEAPTTEGGAR